MKCSTCKLWHRGKTDQARSHQIKKERDLLRQRATDEVMAHHKYATRETATFDVDLDLRRNIVQCFSTFLLCFGLWSLPMSRANAWEFSRNPDRFPSLGFNLNNSHLSGTRGEVDQPTTILTRNQGGTDIIDTYAVGADLRLPVSDQWTVTLLADSYSLDSSFHRNGDAYRESQKLDGYRYGINLRLYFSK